MPSPPPECWTCLLAKTNRMPTTIRYHGPDTAGPGRWIVSDISGPIATLSVLPHEGRYALLYLDKYSTYKVVHAHILTRKSQGPGTIALLDQFFKTTPRTTTINFGEGSILHADNEYDCQPCTRRKKLEITT